MMTGTTALTLDEVRRRAPSAFAMEPDASRSSRYTYIPTGDILQGMMNEGFFPFQASQSRTRDVARREHTKHMIRFRNPDFQTGMEVGDSLPEVVLINSHDGTSAYKLLFGIFRLVCSNGMIVAESMQGAIHVRHQGNIVDAVIQGSKQIVQGAPLVLDNVKQWQALQLSAGEQNAFAEAAHTVRFADADGHVNTPITAAQLLQPRRSDDQGADLWRTLNRVQENVIKGGLSGVARDETGRRIRRVSTRAIKGIDQDVKLNRALWALAEKMAELKAAA